MSPEHVSSIVRTMQSDADILMAQRDDAKAYYANTLSQLEFVQRSKPRVVTLEARWQQCGLPVGDATATLKQITLKQQT